MRDARRRFLQAALGGAAVLASPRILAAQPWPTRYVRFIVPFPPGGSADPIARIVAGKLSEIWGQQVVVENKGGAGGNLGAIAAAQAAPDGYTIFTGTAFLATNPFLYPSIGYNPLADFAPVTLMCNFTNAMVVPSTSPAKTVGEFIALAKASKQPLTCASPGIGTLSHLSCELFKRMASVDLTHVPYRGGGAALNDLMGGRIDVSFATLPSVLGQIQAGAVRVLGVTSAARARALPAVPSVAEAGVPGFDVADFYALFTPAGAPEPILQKVQADAHAALRAPEIVDKLAAIAAEAVVSSPAEVTARIRSEMDKWGPVIKAAGIKAE